MESKVKQMCYEMMISVLEEHHQKIKPGFKAKPLNIKPLKLPFPQEDSKISSIIQSDGGMNSQRHTESKEALGQIFNKGADMSKNSSTFIRPTPQIAQDIPSQNPHDQPLYQ